MNQEQTLFFFWTTHISQNELNRILVPRLVCKCTIIDCDTKQLEVSLRPHAYLRRFLPRQNGGQICQAD